LAKARGRLQDTGVRFADPANDSAATNNVRLDAPADDPHGPPLTRARLPRSSEIQKKRKKLDIPKLIIRTVGVLLGAQSLDVSWVHGIGGS
jgi:hypothetical protein